MAQLVARLNGIQKARGSNPLVSTTLYQSAPLTGWFFIFLEFFSQNINDFIVLQRKGTIFHILKLSNPNLSHIKVFYVYLNRTEFYCLSSRRFSTDKNLCQRHKNLVFALKNWLNSNAHFICFLVVCLLDEP